MQDALNVVADNWWAAPAAAVLGLACNFTRKWLNAKRGK